MPPPPASRNFKQHQPITTALRNITESYPPHTCLREILQNADDAGASELELVLDTRHYPTSPLLHQDLAAFQGPALLARNNGTFRDEDFQSLSSIGDSLKRSDPKTTGKFGQGFNSVYHWTDGPAIYSRQWLLIQDPHMHWSENGGPTWDITAHKESQEIRNQMQAFSAFDIDLGIPYAGTIIRLPLRTEVQAARSKISPKATSIQDVRQVLNNFIEDMKLGSLLFLKKLKKVVVRENDTVRFETEIVEDSCVDASSRQGITDDFVAMYAHASSSRDSSSPRRRVFPIKLRNRLDKEIWTDEYMIAYRMVETCGDAKLDDWAKGQKLFPWTAVAAPMELRQPFEGKLFSILTLNIATQQPVHIHGLFAVAPDRARLGFDTSAVRWNEAMFRQATDTWVELIELLSQEATSRDTLDLWPNPKIIPKKEDLWTEMNGWFIDSILKQNAGVWPGVEGQMLPFRSALFMERNSQSEFYSSAWKAMGLPVVIIEQPLLASLRNRCGSLGEQIPCLTPQKARTHMMINVFSTNEDTRLVIEYCLLDVLEGITDKTLLSKCHDFGKVKVWPTVDGSKIGATTERPLLLPRDEGEQELFSSSRAPQTIHLEALTPKVRSFLQATAAPSNVIACFRSLPDLSLDWHSMYPVVTRTSSATAVRETTKNSTLIAIWKWIFGRFATEEVRKHFLSLQSLWLLPTKGSRLRQIVPCDGVTSILILGTSSRFNSVAEDLTTACEERQSLLLDPRGIEKKAIQELTSLSFQLPDLKILNCNDFEALIEWLSPLNDRLKILSVAQKDLVLEHLAFLLRRGNGKEQDVKPQETLSVHIRTSLKSLPLFRRNISQPPHSRRIIVRDSIGAQTEAFRLPTSIPPFGLDGRFSFYVVETPNECYLVEQLGLLSTCTMEDLFEKCLHPWLMNESQRYQKARLRLIDWIFEQCSGCSDRYRELLGCAPLVPVSLSDKQSQLCKAPKNLVDPQSGIAQLFFKDETVFPTPDFLKKHSRALRTCGLAQGPSDYDLLERIRQYSKRPFKDLYSKVKYLLSSNVTSQLDYEASEEIRTLKWLPAKSPTGDHGKFSPSECRSHDQKDLVDTVLAIVDIRKIEMSPEWSDLLGWEGEIEEALLLRQLRNCVRGSRHSDIDGLLVKLRPKALIDNQPLPCILGRSHSYMTPGRAFYPGTSLVQFSVAPICDRVDELFAVNHAALLKSVGVKEEPELCDLVDIQEELQASSTDGAGTEPLTNDQVLVSIAALELASSLHYDFGNLRVPDTSGILREINDVVYGERQFSSVMAKFHHIHPMLPQTLVARMEIENCFQRATRLKIDYEDEDDDDEYVPQERLTSIIADTLTRYPVDSTFNEFLANADDAGATKICWTLDECSQRHYPSETLFTPELKRCQGPSLMVYNDATFATSDFDGFKEIGQGGKQDQATSTGMFGRGAMTQYHFSDTPMLISGDSFLILDPQQQCLNMRKRNWKRKVGQKLLISTVRECGANLLSPFIGMHGFDEEKNYFDGTLFRFPFREPGTSSALCNSSAHVNGSKTKELLMKYLDTARISLHFLNSVQSISFSFRGETPKWSVSASRPDIMGVFRTMSVVVSEKGKKPKHDLWHIGLRDVEWSPLNVFKTGKSIGKVTEVGVAACLQYNEAQRSRTGGVSTSNADFTNEHRIFCRLPTPFRSSLPISFHASFNVTGDRRSILIDEGDSLSRMNRWLLTESLPEFLIDFLKDAAPRYGEETFDLWPSPALKVVLDKCSKLIHESFWEKLSTVTYRTALLYPVINDDCASESQKFTDLRRKTNGRRIIHRVTSLEKAYFDLMKSQWSDRLLPFLTKLGLDCVRPRNAELRKSLKETLSKAGLDPINANILAGLFREEDHCKALEVYIQGLEHEKPQIEFLQCFWSALVPNPGDQEAGAFTYLHGCRLLPRPRLDLPLGRISNTSSAGKDMQYLATDYEQELFDFSHGDMVNTKLFEKPDVYGRGKDPIKAVARTASNVQRLQLQSVGHLLAAAGSPIMTQDDKVRTWLPKLWLHINQLYETFVFENEIANPTANQCCQEAGIEEMPIFAVSDDENPDYITLSMFEQGTYIIRPRNKASEAMCRRIPAITMINPETVPKQLSIEADFGSLKSLRRFFQALRRLSGGATASMTSSLNEYMMDDDRVHLRNLIINSLNISTDISAEDSDLTHDIDVIVGLPIWPRFQCKRAEGLSKHLSIVDAQFFEHRSMLVSWIVGAVNYLDPDFVTVNSQVLRKLNVRITPPAEFWESNKRNMPPAIPGSSMIFEHRELLRCLRTLKIKPDVGTVPNGLGTLNNAMQLYDHQVKIFRAAFANEQSKFVHEEFRELRDFFLAQGLRTQPANGTLVDFHYVECVQALEKQCSDEPPPSGLLHRCQLVTSHLQYETPALRCWTDDSWREISRSPIFEVRREFSNEPIYRRARMTALSEGKLLSSLNDAEPEKHIRLCWGTRNFLSRPPAQMVFQNRSLGAPPHIDTVYDNLKFMADNAGEINDGELAEYLADVKACYEHLQARLTKDPSKLKFITRIKKDKVWFNLDSTDISKISTSQLSQSLLSARVLCLDAPYDHPTMMRTRKFLAPYERLLALLECPEFKQPTLAGRNVPINDRQFNWSSEFLRLRNSGELVDTVFSAENQRVSAHRIVLATASEYCRTQFAGSWGANLANNSVIPFKFGSEKLATLKILMDFAYGVDYQVPTMKDEDNLDEIADSLDHILDVLACAHAWQMPRLCSQVEDRLLSPRIAGKCIRADNVDDILEQAKELNANQLEKYCWEYLRVNIAGMKRMRASIGSSSQS